MDESIVVVTGASGYIGSHIVANLLSKGMHVRATVRDKNCLLYTSPSPRDGLLSRMPSSG